MSEAHRKPLPFGALHTEDGRPRPPGAIHDDVIAALRAGDDSLLYSEEDEAEDEAEKEAIAEIRSRKPVEAVTAPDTPDQVKTAEPQKDILPPVLRRIFGTESEDELMAVAKFLDERNKRKLKLCFHLEVGNIATKVNWCNVSVEAFEHEKNMLLFMIHSREEQFSPRPGSDLVISLRSEGPAGARQSMAIRATCLTPPMQLYPNVGIDLLCFLPHSAAVVEKNGKLKEGAPSTVSGKPSEKVDEAGEPVAEGEKSASIDNIRVPAKEDFDKPREG